MTRYRLPQSLGGGEWSGTEITEREHGVYVRLTVEAVGYVTLPLAALTELKPPLPEEPPVGSVVSIGVRFYQRRSTTGINWYLIGSDNAWETWQRLCDRSDRLMVYLLEPEPLPEWERELLEGRP